MSHVLVLFGWRACIALVPRLPWTVMMTIRAWVSDWSIGSN